MLISHEEVKSITINADMYNIKVYNRALNIDEIQHNLKTEKKRYKF